MGNHPSSDREIRPMRHRDAEAGPLHATTQQLSQKVEKPDVTWQAERPEPQLLESRRDATHEVKDPPAPPTARLHAIFTRRLHRLNDLQGSLSSQRMELHHQVDNLGHEAVHVHDSAHGFADVMASAKVPSRDVRRQLKDARATLQSDIEAFDVQKQFVTSLMAELRESDIKLDAAGRAFQEVSAAVLTQFHQASPANDGTTSEISIASTPVEQIDETNLADEQVLEPLQDYYDSAIEVRFMQERLDDLHTERAEQLTRRDLVVDQEGVLDETDEEFNCTWDEHLSVAQDNLNTASAALQAAVTVCENLGIAVQAWDSADGRNHPGSPLPVLQDDEQTLALATRPVLAGLDSSTSVAFNADAGVKHKIEEWVVSVELGVTAARPLQHNVSFASVKTPSEPGSVVSDYWKTISIRGANSDQSLRQSASSFDDWKSDSTCQQASTRATSAFSSSDLRPSSSARFTPGGLYPSVEQVITPSEHNPENAPSYSRNGTKDANITESTPPKALISCGNPKRAPTIDSGIGSSIATSFSSRMQVADAEFQRQANPKSFFAQGKVFSTLWTPKNQRDRPKARSLSTTASNEYAFSRIRHFVVIREEEDFCNALEITTHSGNGDPQRPRPTSNVSDVQGIGIRINPSPPNRPIHSSSRVDYTRLCNIEHGVRAKAYGKVDDASLGNLLHRWREVTIRIYQRHPELLVKAVQQPSSQSLDALNFEYKQVKAILKAIADGREASSAIAEVAKISAAERLGSAELADMVPRLMLEGYGYLAAISHARRNGVHKDTSEEAGFNQGQEEAKYDDLDVEDDIGADNDPALGGERLPY